MSNITTVWSIDIPNTAGDVFTSPVVDKNNIVYIGSGKYVYAIGDTGKMPYYRWANEKFDIPSTSDTQTDKEEIYSACSLDSSGDFLYFGTTKGYIYKINALTGIIVEPYPLKISGLLPQPNNNDYIIYTPICIVYDDISGNNIAICSATYDNNTKGVTIAIDTAIDTNDPLQLLLWHHENEFDYTIDNITNTSPNGILFNGIAYNKFKKSVYISTIRHIISLNLSDGTTRCIFTGSDINKPSVCFSTPTVDSCGNILVSALNNYNPSETLRNKLYSLTESGVDNGTTVTFKLDTNWEEDIYEHERLSAAVIDASSNIWLTAKNRIHKLEFTP